MNSSAYNYVTQQYETIEQPMTTMSADELKPYLPQDSNVQSIFECHIGLGESPIHAYIKTMEALTAAYKQRREGN